ncbi:MAG: recombinase family protein [Chthoniobacterales bacterium]
MRNLGARHSRTFFASIAQFERELIIARTKSGIAAARARGKILGRPRVSPAVDVAAIKAMRASGLSWEKISVATGVARSTLMRAAL